MINNDDGFNKHSGLDTLWIHYMIIISLIIIWNNTYCGRLCFGCASTIHNIGDMISKNGGIIIKKGSMYIYFLFKYIDIYKI